jgi:hypothetical protein
MSKPVELPFKEYQPTLQKYSSPNQVQANEYKDIISSALNQAYYQRSYENIDDAALGPLNANVPVYKNTRSIVVDDKPVNVFKQFWQYKSSAGQTFTNYESAGVNAIKEDMAVRDLPLEGMTKSNPDLVLSNTNNVRNNLQNYGKAYLTTTNMLNTEAFKNGVYYEDTAVSPYRSGTGWETEQILHSNFNGVEDGDLYTKMKKELRVDLPLNYANTSISSWQYTNPICIIPNKDDSLIMRHRLKYGIFNLDSMKYIGEQCLTSDFNVIPSGYNKPVDVFSDDMNFPPVSNVDYYNKGDYHYKKSGKSEGLYCSKNTNFVTMPKNYYHTQLDTSFNVSPGNNSLTLGVVMPDDLKKFIQNELYSFNKLQILKAIYLQEQSKSKEGMSHTLKHLIEKYPILKNKKVLEYNNFSEDSKYTYLFNEQRNFHTLHHGSKQLEEFILSLIVFKFGGTDLNHPNIKGHVLIDSSEYVIEEPGVFLLLPSMLSEDLFNLKKDTVGTCRGTNGNNTENSVNCCFRGPNEAWTPNYPNANYVPNMFNDPNNYNNDISNLSNPGCGANPYNAPNSF